MEKPYNSLGFLMGRTLRVMGKHLKDRLHRIDDELAREHWMILNQLRREDGIRQQDLADDFFKDKGTIARAIHQLEGAGLVYRTTDPADKRQRRVYLSDRGQQIGRQFDPVSKEVENLAVAGLNETDVRAFKKMLETIYHNLKSPL